MRHADVKRNIASLHKSAPCAHWQKAALILLKKSVRSGFGQGGRGFLGTYQSGSLNMRRSLIALAGVACAACVSVAALAATGHTQYGTWGVDLSAMDKSVKPGDDFFNYVNGSWYKKAVIPPDRSSIGSF